MKSVVWLVAFHAAAAVASATETPLPPATTFLQLDDDTNFSQSEEATGQSATITQDFVTGVEEQGFVRTSATASATLGSAPSAAVFGVAESMLDPADPPAQGLRQRAHTSAAASATYYARLSALQTLPTILQSILVPLEAAMFVSTNVSTTGAALATAQISLVDARGGTFPLATIQAASGSSFPSFSDSRGLNPLLRVAPDQVLRILVSASGSTAPINDGTGGFFALADPTFSFDQEEFDRAAQNLGVPSVTLGDYFGIEFSENLLVPEPGSSALGAAALLGAAVMRSFRSTRGSPPRARRFTRTSVD
jgi:hypothetical protein